MNKNLLAVLIFISDYFTKMWAGIVLSSPIYINPFLNFSYVENKGVTFGLISGWLPPWMMALLSVVICVILWIYVWPKASSKEKYGYTAIFSGALGNALDRIIEGAVVDFIDFHIETYHWPAFNIADIAICCGVGWLLFLQIRNP